MAVDALVRDDLEETLTRVLQRCEFDAQTLDFVKGLFREDLGLDIPDLQSTDLVPSRWCESSYSPRCNDVDAAAIMMYHSSQRMHDPPHSVLCRLVLRSTRTIQIASATADEDETGVFLLVGHRFAVLGDKMVSGQFGSEEHTVDVDFDNLEIGFARTLGVVGKDVVVFGDPRIGHDVMDVAVVGESLGLLEEAHLVFPRCRITSHKLASVQA